MTTDQFIQKARLRHGNRYIYDFVRYVRSYLKIKIVCRIHGPFEQQPDHHLRGQGCRKCSGEYRRSIQAKSTENFIAAVKRIHAGRYDYSRSVYFNNLRKVIIGCPKHGWFTQSPQRHLRGSGCKRCAAEAASLANTGDTTEFIRKAKTVWGPRYLYPETRYTGSRKQVTIILGSTAPLSKSRGSTWRVFKAARSAAMRTNAKHTTGGINKALSGRHWP